MQIGKYAPDFRSRLWMISDQQRVVMNQNHKLHTQTLALPVTYFCISYDLR